MPVSLPASAPVLRADLLSALSAGILDQTDLAEHLAEVRLGLTQLDEPGARERAAHRSALAALTILIDAGHSPSDALDRVLDAVGRGGRRSTRGRPVDLEAALVHLGDAPEHSAIALARLSTALLDDAPVA